MSVRSLLMPFISQRLLSHERMVRLRDKAEQRRLRAKLPHEVHYFHQVDDPYSALTAQALPTLAARYDIQLIPHLVGQPPADAAPERALLQAYSRRDATMLAEQVGLEFVDPGQEPLAQSQAELTACLVAAMQQGNFVANVAQLSQVLWSAPSMESSTLPPWPAATTQQVAAHLSESNALRERLGHYLGATFFYGGEWYWGIDRIHHLEARLQALGASRTGVQGAMFPMLSKVRPVAQGFTASTPAAPIDFYFSFRSPYSAIAAPRVFELARLHGAEVRLRYLLPMVMRGLPVPAAKRRYIAFDAAREARAQGIAFGRINDPVGRPTERGLSLLPLAESQGCGQAYVLSFFKGVWAEGIDAGSDRGLRRIAERAGLNWQQAKACLQDEGWRAVANANREALLGLGLWGVPSFQVGPVSVWGQDRLWAVQAALAKPGLNVEPKGVTP